MIQNPFDGFSKEFLADLLAPYGTVGRSLRPSDLTHSD